MGAAPGIYPISTAVVDAITTAVVTKDGPTDNIPVDRGVLQGYTLSLYLFIMVMDRVLKRAQLDPASRSRAPQ
jgi:hypothetical protein